MTDTDLGEITYCVMKCTVKRRGELLPKRTRPPALLCRDCVDRVKEWLREIPTHFALLPVFIQPGSVDADPGSHSTKMAWAPAPVRLDVIDLLDARYGRKWMGTAPAELRRGPLGDLIVEAQWVVEARGVTPATPPDLMTMSQVTAMLARHVDWIATQPEAKDFYNTVRKIHRALANGVGEFHRPPVAHCHITRPDGTLCGGPIYASDYGGVECARCKNTWDPGQLRLLGLAQEDKENA